MALLKGLKQYAERGQKFTGVFYLEHETRRYRMAKDKQLVLRYTIAGKTCTEVLGWLSEGYTAQDAQNMIKVFRANHKVGERPTSLSEERSLAADKRKAKDGQKQLEIRRNTTISEYFYGDYLDAAKENKKAATVVSEESLFKKWIKPTMGDIRIKDVVPLDFQRLKNKVLKGDRCVDDKGKVYYVPKSARTVHYCVSIVIQVWNMAFDNKVVDIQPPRRKTLNLPMIDNERSRAFTPEQAKAYFEHMDVRSKQWADITRVSLFAGLRASEVFKLKVKDFDEERGRLFLQSPKKQKSQTLVLNDTAFELFKVLKKAHPTKNGFFFLTAKDEQITSVSNTVQAAIDKLGFNDGITDQRDRLTFHSWRHTNATWLLDNGTDIYTVSALLRHSTLAMTRRYIHPQEEKLRDAAKGIDDVFNSQKIEKGRQSDTK
jgi:integrase